MIVFIQIINNYMITQKYIFFKMTKCLQYHGKILPALTRWMSRISFPSPSYSKKFKNFPLVGEILGLFSNRMGDGGRGRRVGGGVNASRNQPETQPDPITHGIHQYNHCNHCNHNDNTYYQHKPTYWQPTANSQQTNAKQLPRSPNMSLLVTPMEQSQSTATCNETKTKIMLIIWK